MAPWTHGLQRPLDAGKTPGLHYVAVDAAGTRAEFHGGLADIAAGRPVQAATTMMAYSMSKTITAAAVMTLVEAGRIGIDDPLARYVERQPYGSAVTVRQLLTHTSGIPNPLPLRWVHPAADHAAFDERAALDAVLGAHPRLAFAPGTRFAYSNIGYWLLGLVVSRASGQPFTAYVLERVLGPLGIPPSAVGYAIPDPAAHAGGYLEKYSLMNLIKPFLIDRALIGGYEGRWLRIRDHYPNGPAFGGLVGTVSGFAAFLQDQLREQSRLFGAATRALFFEPQHTSDGRAIPMTPGWHIGTLNGRRYFFKEGGGGGFHCMMRVYPDANVASVVMTNATSFDVNGLLDAVDPQVR